MVRASVSKGATVRSGTLAEAKRVNARVAEFDVKARAKGYFEGRLQGKETLVLIAEIGRALAGYTVAYDRFEDGSFYCWMAGVDPRFRRKGALTALMRELEQRARAKGYARLRITTRNSRREMLSYLVKSGYHALKVKRRERVEDNRILFEKAL